MIAAISISSTAVMAADTKEPITEIPNPITEYRTYGEVSAALGFSPLYLPGLAGYQCRYISAISGKTGDIRYVKEKLRCVLPERAAWRISAACMAPAGKSAVSET